MNRSVSFSYEAIIMHQVKSPVTPGMHIASTKEKIMTKRHIVIATRESPLALRQADSRVIILVMFSLCCGVPPWGDEC